MGDELTAWVSFEEMKKGGWCMIKGNPCKVTDITAKVKGIGASANDRVVITGTHFLTGKQSTDTINLTNAHDGLEVPVTSKKKYTLLDVDTDSGFLSLLTDDGDTKEDASLSKKEDESGERVWDDVGTCGPEVLPVPSVLAAGVLSQRGRPCRPCSLSPGA